MNVTEILLIALALAMDATVYAFSYGLVLRERRATSALWLALTVGAYQAGMPLLGYLGGMELRDALAAWDHWIVLAVFAVLGGNIIYKAWCGRDDGGDAASKGSPLGFAALMLAGIATSIDALAVGAGMALGSIGGALDCCGLAAAVGIIGGVTFACALAAFHAARPLQKLPTQWLETLAGLLLIGLGVQNVLRELL